MEKYFIVTEQSDLYKDYMEYKANSKERYEIADKFMKDNNIESNEFNAESKEFYIIPTDNDLKNFDNVLCNPLAN